MKKKQMSYSELVNYVEEHKYLTTKFDVVCWLIGYQKIITEADVENIRRLYVDGIVD